MKLIIILIVIVGLGALGLFAFKKFKNKQNSAGPNAPSKSDMSAAMIESVTIQSSTTKPKIKPLARVADGVRKVFGRKSSQPAAIYTVS